MKSIKSLTSLAILASSLCTTNARLLNFSSKFNTITYLEDKSGIDLKPDYLPVEKFDFDYDAKIIYTTLNITSEESVFYINPLYHGSGKLVIYEMELNNENNCKLENENTLIDSYELITENENKTILGSSWGGAINLGILFHLNDGCSFTINANHLTFIPENENPYDLVFTIPLINIPVKNGYDPGFFIHDGFTSDHYEPIYKRLDDCKFNYKLNAILCTFENNDKKYVMSDITIDNSNNCDLQYNGNTRIRMSRYYLDGKEENSIINEGYTTENKFEFYDGSCTFYINIGKMNFPNYEDYSNTFFNLKVKFNVKEGDTIYPIENCYYLKNEELICGKGDKTFKILSFKLKNLDHCSSIENPITNIHFYQNGHEMEYVPADSSEKDYEILLDLADGCQLHVSDVDTKLVDRVESIPFPKYLQFKIGNISRKLGTPEHPSYILNLNNCEYNYVKKNIQCEITDFKTTDIIKEEYHGAAKFIFDDMTIEEQGNCTYFSNIKDVDLVYKSNPSHSVTYVGDYIGNDIPMLEKKFIIYFSDGCTISAEYQTIDVKPFF